MRNQSIFIAFLLFLFVSIVVGCGQKNAPNVIGTSSSAAQTTIAQNGLTLNLVVATPLISDTVSPTIEQGSVWAQTPVGGDPLNEKWMTIYVYPIIATIPTHTPTPTPTLSPTPTLFPTPTPTATETSTPTPSPSPTPTMAEFPTGSLVASHYKTPTLYLQFVKPNPTTGNGLPYITSTQECGCNCWFPSWSSDGDKVAFVKEDEGNGTEQIFIVDGTEQIFITGSKLTKLTTLTGEKITFVWKPDGGKIAFVQQSDSVHKIWFAYNGNGSTQKELHSSDSLHLVEDIRQLSWHSNHIAVASSKGIYIYTLDSEDDLVFRKRISDIPANSVAWSPDGTHLAFASEKGIYTFKPDGKDRKRLSTRGSSAVAWSPDGHWLAYLTDGGTPDLWVIEMENGTIAREWIIIEEVGTGNLNYLSLSWVPE